MGVPIKDFENRHTVARCPSTSCPRYHDSRSSPVPRNTPFLLLSPPHFVLDFDGAMSSSGVPPPASILEEHVKLEDGPPVRASAHNDGTFHQSQLVGRDVRRGFFSPPDAALAEAVNHDADTVEFTEAEEASSILTLPDLSPHRLYRSPGSSWL